MFIIGTKLERKVKENSERRGLNGSDVRVSRKKKIFISKHSS